MKKVYFVFLLFLFSCQVVRINPKVSQIVNVNNRGPQNVTRFQDDVFLSVYGLSKNHGLCDSIAVEVARKATVAALKGISECK